MFQYLVWVFLNTRANKNQQRYRGLILLSKLAHKGVRLLLSDKHETQDKERSHESWKPCSIFILNIIFGCLCKYFLSEFEIFLRAPLVLVTIVWGVWRISQNLDLERALISSGNYSDNDQGTSFRDLQCSAHIVHWLVCYHWHNVEKLSRRVSLQN